MEIEMTIFDYILPVNTLAVLRRIEEILRNNQTNSLTRLKGDDLAKCQACIIILSEQAYMSWDFHQEYRRVKDKLQHEYVATKLTSFGGYK